MQTDKTTSVTEELISMAVDRFSSEYPENESLVPEFRNTLIFMLDNGISELHRRDSWRLEVTSSPMASISITYIPETTSPTKSTPVTEHPILKRMMKQAVQDENYKLAAILHDRIRSFG